MTPRIIACALSILALSAIAFEDVLLSFAESQAAAKQAGKPLAQFSVVAPNAKNYHAEVVQKHYVRRLLDNEEFAGIKGAVVGEGGQKFFEIDGPLSAVLFKSGWHDAKDQPIIAIREGANPGVETELGLILAEPITEKVESVEALKKKVRALVPVIELPAGLHNWPQKPKAIDLTAANVDSDNFIVGTASTDLTIDLDALPIQLFRGQQLLNETTGGDAKNGQWSNFLRQVNWAVEQGYELEPGHLVITGALGKIIRDGAGSYRATFGALGEIEFALE
ncbi:MAG: 2-keto-4-pentenoate hydratase [Verrucomicrobiales bacterium]|jgi:2-keto-4-pentenoate hydratase